MTEVKTSLIPNAGRGVFAKKDFKKGEQVCYYDGYKKDNPSDFERRYRLGDKIGYYSPRTPDGTAQIMNDPAYFEVTDELLTKLSTGTWKERALTALKMEKDYRVNSYKLGNVTTDRNTSWFVAKRDIKAGEEIYWGYGSTYWINFSKASEKALEGAMLAVNLPLVASHLMQAQLGVPSSVVGTEDFHLVAINTAYNAVESDELTEKIWNMFLKNKK